MLSIDEIIVKADMEACEDCSHYGEPNGCNRTEGTCKGYEMLQDAVRYLEWYKSKDAILREPLLAFLSNTKLKNNSWLCDAISNKARFPKIEPSKEI